MELGRRVQRIQAVCQQQDRQTGESLLDPSCQSGKFTSYVGYQLFTKINLGLQHISVIQPDLFICPFIIATFQTVFIELSPAALQLCPIYNDQPFLFISCIFKASSPEQLAIKSIFDLIEFPNRIFSNFFWILRSFLPIFNFTAKKFFC